VSRLAPEESKVSRCQHPRHSLSWQGRSSRGVPEIHSLIKCPRLALAVAIYFERLNGHPTSEQGTGCASEVNRFIAVFDTRTMPTTARMGDKAKPSRLIPRRLCCLNFRMSDSVILCSPSQAAERASHNSLISAGSSPQRVRKTKPPTSSCQGLLFCATGAPIVAPLCLLGRAAAFVLCPENEMLPVSTTGTAVLHTRRARGEAGPLRLTPGGPAVLPQLCCLSNMPKKAYLCFVA
jgi:hypothetical protein